MLERSVLDVEPSTQTQPSTSFSPFILSPSFPELCQGIPAQGPSFAISQNGLLGHVVNANTFSTHSLHKLTAGLACVPITLGQHTSQVGPIALSSCFWLFIREGHLTPVDMSIDHRSVLGGTAGPHCLSTPGQIFTGVHLRHVPPI